MGGLLHLVQRGGARAGCSRAPSLLTVPNQRLVYQSLYCYMMGQLFCGFDVAIKGLSTWQQLNISLQLRQTEINDTYQI